MFKKKGDLQSILKLVGFNEKEGKVYLTLLELREALPSSISRKSGLKRPTTYVVLEQLKKKGLVSHVKKNGALYFRAVNPTSIVEDQKKRFENLKDSLPELLSLHEKFENTPQMSVYEGKEGLIQIMEDTLNTKSELLCWANPNIVMDLLKEYYPSYIKKKVKRKIWLRGIFCYDKIGLDFKKNGKKELREVYLVPEKKFPFKNEINIYDDKVAIISHQDAVGVIIQNQNIADTQKSIFNLAFEYAKILERKLLSKEDQTYLKSRGK